jgi:hypothetical protein
MLFVKPFLKLDLRVVLDTEGLQILFYYSQLLTDRIFILLCVSY